MLKGWLTLPRDAGSHLHAPWLLAAAAATACLPPSLPPAPPPSARLPLSLSLSLLAWREHAHNLSNSTYCRHYRRQRRRPRLTPFTLSAASPPPSQVLIGIAAARCWRSLSLGDSQLLAAWAASAVVLPAWRRFAPAHYNNSRYRKPLEAALRLANTASPTAVAMGVLSADKTAAGLQRLITAGLLVAGVLTSKGGLWGGLHVSGAAGAAACRAGAAHACAMPNLAAALFGSSCRAAALDHLCRAWHFQGRFGSSCRRTGPSGRPSVATRRRRPAHKGHHLFFT